MTYSATANYVKNNKLRITRRRTTIKLLLIIILFFPHSSFAQTSEDDYARCIAYMDWSINFHRQNDGDTAFIQKLAKNKKYFMRQLKHNSSEYVNDMVSKHKKEMELITQGTTKDFSIYVLKGLHGDCLDKPQHDDKTSAKRDRPKADLDEHDLARCVDLSNDSTRMFSHILQLKKDNERKYSQILSAERSSEGAESMISTYESLLYNCQMRSNSSIAGSSMDCWSERNTYESAISNYNRSIDEYNYLIDENDAIIREIESKAQDFEQLEDRINNKCYDKSYYESDLRLACRKAIAGNEFCKNYM